MCRNPEIIAIIYCICFLSSLVSIITITGSCDWGADRVGAWTGDRWLNGGQRENIDVLVTVVAPAHGRPNGVLLEKSGVNGWEDSIRPGNDVDGRHVVVITVGVASEISPQ